MSFTTCPACNKTGQYNEQFDSYYCEECNVWIDNMCTDSHCDFCMGRPEKPNQEKKVDE